MKTRRYFYSETISAFCEQDQNFILGELASRNSFSLEEMQRNAWQTQIIKLKEWLHGIEGHILFEYTIPRMGKRIDCVIISGAVIFALEFKVGATKYGAHALTQVMDYALDLKNFHLASHQAHIIPILVSTEAIDKPFQVEFYADKIAKPLLTNGQSLKNIILECTSKIQEPDITAEFWINSPYSPTPTIIEAAQALYQNHSVEEISRSDAGAFNLSKTATSIAEVIRYSKENGIKSICFLTGVPGAGKTLAGLNLACSSRDVLNSEHAVFLSGNGPLVKVLQEALARNEVEMLEKKGTKISKAESLRKARLFIQNIHLFRDEGIKSKEQPKEHVVIFDEAQRAWDLKQTKNFMQTKKGISSFNQSEPEFLISLMDRHQDWATIICLIGGGQEINKGEAGIQEWFKALEQSFPHWSIYASSKIVDQEYAQAQNPFSETIKNRVNLVDELHLDTCIRSFRSEKVATFVAATLNGEVDTAKRLYHEFEQNYPIVITRCLQKAKKWLRQKARGSERYGLIASSSAIRLKPYGINVKQKVDPTHWFLNHSEDIRSSYYLEDVATEFDIQGLELDWTCLSWDADLRHDGSKWVPKDFRGTSWQNIKDINAQTYLKNSYRVLLTRARQGMVIFIPPGDQEDQTRPPSFYDHTYNYLASIGIQELN
ncbi:DUF2075 domain-containing protein [Estrella lausannensis]|uniref:Schlafen group 3-like DNA/RNA helicase domain-containing protein n=1 Tax=Estrella lausannensis TaxID=483423 RepID=A0A0H5DPM5_9BACT|nr:DUF2075 domain-containing protein [Estrella lausannensis]CRX37958.1 hypothetical protein ELAC_0603 [Estrella lausannensis]